MDCDKGADSFSAIENLWHKQALNLPWMKQWDKVLDWREPYAKWFINGQLNASDACVDIHVKNGLGDKVAIYWESEDESSLEITYYKLYQEVNKAASMLRNLGVQKGDFVVIYMPMVPEAIYSMLAVARLGAVHTTVFSGFSAQALRSRIEETQAKWIITTDIGLRRGKLIPIKNVVDKAADGLDFVKKIVVVRRNQSSEPSLHADRDILWSDALKSASEYVAPVAVDSNDPLFVLYTSGTTGKPKGVVHNIGGYLTYVYSTIKWAFDIDNQSIYWSTADLGWVTGHSYVLYGPLLHGASMLMYEGAPDYPNYLKWWELIEKYKVSIFYTSPTALRMLRLHTESTIKNFKLDSLKVLGSVGESINPEIWHWFNEAVGHSKCPIVDTWWQTETGGFMISPAVGLDLVSLKPGSATRPLPGIDADVVDELGQSLPNGSKGYLVIKKPWPGMAVGLYNDHDKFKECYWSKFGGMYYSGDYAIKDADGYFWILGRADEVLNIAGHRIGTAEVESAAIVNPKVAEAAAIGVPDQIKGECVVIFVVLQKYVQRSPDLCKEIINTVRSQIGAFVTPAEIFFVDSLPKTRSGKIMRRVLKALAKGDAVGDFSTCEDESTIEEISLAYNNLKHLVAGRFTQEI